MNEIPDYVIAIRSHKRADTIKNKTLRVLKESGYDWKFISHSKEVGIAYRIKE